MKTITIDINTEDHKAIEYYANIRGVSVDEYVRMLAGIPPLDPKKRREYFLSLLPVKEYGLNAKMFCENEEGQLTVHTADDQVRVIHFQFIPLLGDMGIITKL